MNFAIEGIDYQLGELELELLKFHPEYAPVLAKTGMPRHFQSNLPLHELATQAASRLLAQHEAEIADMGALLLVTQSSEFHLPSTAALVHQSLGLPPSVMALDLNQGCSGFVQALCLAVPLTKTHQNVLIVCADRYRSKLRKGDRSTESVFSDAASAVLIKPNGPLQLKAQSHYTDGSGAQYLRQETGSKLTMAGADVFLWTRNKVAKQIAALIEDETAAGRAPHTVFLHQASKLVIDSLKSVLPKDISIPTNFETVGNTVSSSIPILLAANLDVLNRSGSLLLAGFGVGLSSSVVAIEMDHDLKR
jgi:3-oxoacyl-[acyl-carrier-protein] synthase-3